MSSRAANGGSDGSSNRSLRQQSSTPETDLSSRIMKKIVPLINGEPRISAWLDIGSVHVWMKKVRPLLEEVRGLPIGSSQLIDVAKLIVGFIKHSQYLDSTGNEDFDFIQEFVVNVSPVADAEFLRKSVCSRMLSFVDDCLTDDSLAFGHIEQLLEKAVRLGADRYRIAELRYRLEEIEQTKTEDDRAGAVTRASVEEFLWASSSRRQLILQRFVAENVDELGTMLECFYYAIDQLRPKDPTSTFYVSDDHVEQCLKEVAEKF